jgi:hypothetical protein
MWTIGAQPGLTTVIVDFTGALSPLLEGLLRRMALSTGLLVALALRAYPAQPSTSVVTRMPGADQEAA